MIKLDYYCWVSNPSADGFAVVYTSKTERNELLDRLERSTGGQLERKFSMPMAEVKEMYPDSPVVSGWIAKAVGRVAFLAQGLSAFH